MNGTRFEQKSFSVPAVDKAPEACQHGWLDRRGKCVLCGARVGYFVTPQEVEGSDALPENGGLLVI